MENLLISGNTTETNEWNLDSIFTPNHLDPKERIYHYEVDRNISKTTDNFTFVDIDWLNLNYNN